MLPNIILSGIVLISGKYTKRNQRIVRKVRKVKPSSE
jgi:hypothetical protein